MLNLASHLPFCKARAGYFLPPSRAERIHASPIIFNIAIPRYTWAILLSCPTVLDRTEPTLDQRLTADTHFITVGHRAPKDMATTRQGASNSNPADARRRAYQDFPRALPPRLTDYLTNPVLFSSPPSTQPRSWPKESTRFRVPHELLAHIRDRDTIKLASTIYRELHNTEYVSGHSSLVL